MILMVTIILLIRLMTDNSSFRVNDLLFECGSLSKSVTFLQTVRYKSYIFLTRNWLALNLQPEHSRMI